jgi:hypothetical protein
MKLRWLFSQQTHVIHSIRPKTHVNRKCLISKCSGPFRYSTKVDEKLVELVPLAHKFGKRSCVGSFATNAPDLVHWPQSQVLGHLGPFRYCTKVDAKLAELAPLTPKFAKQALVLIFRKERIRSTPLDSKLMFWSVSDRFVTGPKSMQNLPN